MGQRDTVMIGGSMRNIEIVAYLGRILLASARIWFRRSVEETEMEVEGEVSWNRGWCGDQVESGSDPQHDCDLRGDR